MKIKRYNSYFTAAEWQADLDQLQTRANGGDTAAADAVERMLADRALAAFAEEERARRLYLLDAGA